MQRNSRGYKQAVIRAAFIFLYVILSKITTSFLETDVIAIKSIEICEKIVTFSLDNVMGLFSSKSVEVDMDGPVSQMVKDLIASDSVVIFSKTYCPYCTMAKKVFDDIPHKYTTVELDSRDDADSIQAYLGHLTGAKTVPRVFLNGECIGGGSDVKKLYETGKLVSMLDA